MTPEGDSRLLFEKDVVHDLLAASIILYLMEECHSADVDEDKIAEFVVKNFDRILEALTED